MPISLMLTNVGRHNVLRRYQADWATMQASEFTGPVSYLSYGSRIISYQYFQAKRCHNGGQIRI
jgi:hypothetical protein